MWCPFVKCILMRSCCPANILKMYYGSGVGSVVGFGVGSGVGSGGGVGIGRYSNPNASHISSSSHVTLLLATAAAINAVSDKFACEG